MTPAERWIETNFPNLRSGGYAVTSPNTPDYNCIAWAAEDTGRWWWPHPDSYWPGRAPQEETIAAFVQAFQTRGYQPCENGAAEAGFVKIAIYADVRGVPTHAARQLPSGGWTSKLGQGWDIEHADLSGIENIVYGQVVQFMEKPE